MKEDFSLPQAPSLFQELSKNKAQMFFAFEPCFLFYPKTPPRLKKKDDKKIDKAETNVVQTTS